MEPEISYLEKDEIPIKNQSLGSMLVFGGVLLIQKEL